MKKTLAVLFLFIQTNIKGEYEYRIAFWLDTVSFIFGYGAQALLMIMLTRKFDTINGWTPFEVMLLYAYTLDQLHSEMEQPDFWNNLEPRAEGQSAHQDHRPTAPSGIANLRTQCEDIRTLVQMCDEEQDESLVPEIEGELESLRKHVEEMHLATLLRGEYDSCDCILSLHAGAGGTEAQDWTQMLYRMYTRYAERHGFTVRRAGFPGGG